MIRLKNIWLTTLALVAMVGCATSTDKYTAVKLENEQLRSQLSLIQSHTSGASAAALESSLIPGQTTPTREEELWVIAKYQDDKKPAADETVPGSGALLARLPDQTTPVPVPLKHTDVQANIAGYIATVDVTQQYHNPFNSKIEAVYVFPLPHNAAVNEFVMTIGQRKIRGVIRERHEAQRIYENARAQGYVASLLTQQRPNIFTQSVANIEPGHQIDINIKYFHTLDYNDGWYEWHFPMVVGPRFNPPPSDVGWVASATLSSPQIPYLTPKERSGHDISLTVHLNAGVKIEQLEIPSHHTSQQLEGPTATITLANDDTIPNKDFILRYRVAGDQPKSALLTTSDKTGNYFSLMLIPPQSLNHLPRKPLELVYVLDCSGSMSGQPIAQAQSAIRTSLALMQPDDTFQIIKFSSAAQLMSDAPLAASPRNIANALQYLDQPYGGGGPMMIEGIRKALDAPTDESRLRFVCFLTDGFIGNETEILREIHDRLGQSRIFSFGVGSSVNRYLLDHMAKMGRGAVAYLALNQKPESIMEAFFNRISHPALTNLAIDWSDLNATDVFPSALPDLFVGRPLIITGKFTGNPKAKIRITGQQNNEQQQLSPPTLSSAPKGSSPIALHPLWARAKIADLADRSAWNPDPNLPSQIKSLALEHNLMSPFTAFLAIDSTRQTQGAYGTTVSVPVPIPQGTRYETTVAPK